MTQKDSIDKIQEDVNSIKGHLQAKEKPKQINEKESISTRILKKILSPYTQCESHIWNISMGLLFTFSFAVVISLVVAYRYGEIICIDKDTFYYLFSSIIQGFAALLAISAALIGFGHEYIWSPETTEDRKRDASFFVTTAFIHIGFVLFIAIFALGILDLYYSSAVMNTFVLTFVLLWTLFSFGNFWLMLYNLFNLGIPTDQISNGVKELAKWLRDTHTKVLDVGPGCMGKNSIFLAKKGHHVDAIDRKIEWVESIKRAARINEFEDRVKVWKDDIRTARLDKGKYDAVLMCRVIHLMGNEKTALSVVQKIQSATKPGGYNLIDFFIQWPGVKDEPKKFIPMPGKLQAFYKDWKIVRYVERPKVFYHGDWEKTAWLIVKKPK